MRTGHSAHSRSGLTLLEILLASVILTIVIYKGVSVMGSAARTSSEDSAEILLEEQAQIVLERIARAVMGSNRETLDPAQPAPGSSDEIQYAIHLGLQDGEVVWSEPELIGLEDVDNEVFWMRNPEAPTQRVVWSKLVSPYLENEIPNGKDDNGNGLIDEKGLSFVVDRDAVTIYLTLDRRTSDGRIITHSVQTTVTCRNLAPESP